VLGCTDQREADLVDYVGNQAFDAVARRSCTNLVDIHATEPVDQPYRNGQPVERRHDVSRQHIPGIEPFADADQLPTSQLRLSPDLYGSCHHDAWRDDREL
jgi:hypothetical protein